MASQTLKQRPRDEPTNATTSTSSAATDANKRRRARKVAMARRGLRSLVVAVGMPLMLTALTLYIVGCGGGGMDIEAKAKRPFFYVASATCSSLMGLAAWLVWAEGGFHRRPAALGFYVAQLVLGLAWAPIVLGAGAPRAGLCVCAALLGALLGCAQSFKRVNPIAGDLVKPCLAWAAVLAIFNYKLM